MNPNPMTSRTRSQNGTLNQPAECILNLIPSSLLIFPGLSHVLKSRERPSVNIIATRARARLNELTTCANKWIDDPPGMRTCEPRRESNSIDFKMAKRIRWLPDASCNEFARKVKFLAPFAFQCQAFEALKGSRVQFTRMLNGASLCGRIPTALVYGAPLFLASQHIGEMNRICRVSYISVYRSCCCNP